MIHISLREMMAMSEAQWAVFVTAAGGLSNIVVDLSDTGGRSIAALSAEADDDAAREREEMQITYAQQDSWHNPRQT